MYRVALVAALAVSLGACSLNTGAITSGFADQGSSSSTVTGSIDPLNIDSYREQSVRTNVGVRASY